MNSLTPKAWNVFQLLKVAAGSVPVTRHFMKIEQRNIVTAVTCFSSANGHDKGEQGYQKTTELLSDRVFKPLKNTSSNEDIILSKEISHRLEIAQNENASEILSKLPPEDEKRLKVIKLEYDVWTSLGVKVPDDMTPDMWLEILRKCPSPSSRRKTYSFWFKREKKKQNQKIKKLEKQLLKSEEKPVEPREQSSHLFNRITKQKMNEHSINNMAHAMVHGPHLVIDCGYEDTMRDKELKDLSRQLTYCYAYNKASAEPFHVALMNCDMKGALCRLLHRDIIGLEGIPITVTDESYLDIFPRKDIVYLTPDADKTLDQFDYNDIYVIGGIVDRAREDPLTLAAAKREGLRYAKFPLDKHLDWNQGTKSLTLDQVFKILMELKTSQDWKKALQHVPTRKLR